LYGSISIYIYERKCHHMYPIKVPGKMSRTPLSRKQAFDIMFDHLNRSDKLILGLICPKMFLRAGESLESLAIEYDLQEA